MEIYKKLVVTPESEYLDELISSLDKARMYLKSLDLNEVDKSGKPIMPMDKYQKIIKDSIPLLGMLKNARKDIEKDIVENEKIRGNKTKTVSDDGFRAFFR